MIAVIFGLVAVVLLVLVVVALGMRSMNRRESNLPPERLRKMAEQAETPDPKRPGQRPAEETFFESFPEGFDAFQEPERATARLRPGNGKPGNRPAGRPGGRSAPRGKQPASSRGRRGVDEWGDADDYDDDYWTRVRADDGAFGGTIAARVGASRPDVASPSAYPASPTPPKPPAPKARDEAASEATTVQAPLPNRAAGLAEPAREAAPPAAERTVTFPAPVPQTPAAAPPTDVLGAMGAPQSPPRPRRPARPDPADPLGVGDAAARPKPRRRGDAGGDPGRPAPGRGGDPRRADTRRTSPPRGVPSAGPSATRADSGTPPNGTRGEAGRTDPSRTATGPFAAGRPAEPPSRETADPLAGTPLSSSTRIRPGVPRSGDPLAAPRGPASRADDPLSTAPRPATPSAPDLLSSGPLPGGRAARGPVSQNPLSTGPLSTSGPAETNRPSSFDPVRPSSGSFESPRAAGTGPSQGSGSYGRGGDPLAPASGGPGEQSWPARPAYPAAGTYDILDGPGASPSGSNETWKSSDYQLPAYGARPDGYTAPAAPAAPSAPSYEVSAGWATIDDGDSVTGPTPSPGLPAGPPRGASGYEPPAQRDRSGTGRGAAGSDQGYGPEPGRPPAAEGEPGQWPQPPQNAGGSWPSYAELYGQTGSTAADPRGETSRSRGGHRRSAEPDYPDYYR
ncbi:hypothetical protein [Sphaerisporangium sp. TRM90804]|uniref:hypothetical protein n=1 Tax=Sphaerisporangium sp. TRM90804 TaxID=3031113 RepID=UPI00244A698B|nr:hypothetical protein [Sphaerisporangium sp. TRM90804]MDH2424313.1 hypothetical protein [Sphaerisporangium sp. TRM90804]